MERLTGKRDGRTYIIGCPDFALPKIVGLIIQQAVGRLAAYEETGLEPEEVRRCLEVEDVCLDEYITFDRLRELAKADREGRRVVLPCKIGTPVWAIGPECGKYFVRKAKFSMAKLDYLGETVFFTREEAEAALEGMKNG